MRQLRNTIIAALALLMCACYASYDNDFEYSTVYFASQKPLRTVIFDTNPTIKVGVSIGGKREINPADWATFTIDPTLLIGTPFKLMPESYYSLSNASKMTISNTNLAIADVEITFNEAFANDNNSYGNYYAIPFKITGHNLDSIGISTSGEKKDYSIVVVKAVSKYHGTYYIKGNMVKLNADETPGTSASDSTRYEVADLSKNITRDLSSISRYVILRPGFANSVLNPAESVKLTIAPDGSSLLIEPGSTSAITNTACTLNLLKDQPEFNLQYTFDRAGIKYKVNELLIRRQNPEYDLRFEEW